VLENFISIPPASDAGSLKVLGNRVYPVAAADLLLLVGEKQEPLALIFFNQLNEVGNRDPLPNVLLSIDATHIERRRDLFREEPDEACVRVKIVVRGVGVKWIAWLGYVQYHRLLRTKAQPE